MRSRWSSYAFVAVVALSLSTVACAANDEAAAAGTASESQDVTVENGKFELFNGTDGEFYFRFVAGNGVKLLQSEGYTTKVAAVNGVDAVIADAPDTRNVDILESTNNAFYFVVKAGNGEIIATSQMYTTKASAQKGALATRQLTRMIADETTSN